MDLKTLSGIRIANKKEFSTHAYLAPNAGRYKPRKPKHDFPMEEFAESMAVWKILRNRFRYDPAFKQLFTERFADCIAFHPWRKERFPVVRSKYVLSFLYEKDRLQANSIDEYAWLPYEIWANFFLCNDGEGLLHGVTLSRSGSGNYSARITVSSVSKHLGTTTTELAAHRLWQQAKRKVLLELEERYKKVVHESVLVWLEYWAMVLEQDFANNRPTVMPRPAKGV